MAKRVHQLAKELGVKSTAIVSKCQDEGLDIKNHMSTLSAGLEATIREWFSAGEHATTVETSDRVDLEKVRVAKPKKKAKADKAKTTPDESSEKVAVATEAAPSKPKRISPTELATTETTAVTAVEPAAEAAPPVEEKVVEETTQPQPSTEEENAAAKLEPTQVDIAAESDEKDQGPEETPEAQESEPAAPAAPKAPVIAKGLIPINEADLPKPKPVTHIPEPAKLQGPRVIRVERPDVTAPPPPSRGSRRPPMSRPAGMTPAVDAPVQDDSHAARKSRRRGGAASDEGEGTRKKSAGRGGRRHSRYDSPTGISVHEWGDRDLQERQQRLASASASKLHGRERRLAKGEKSTPGQIAQHPRVETATIKEPITVKELSATIGVRAPEIIGKLMGMGVMATINQTIDADAAMTIALEYGVDLTVEEKTLMLTELAQQFDAEPAAEELSPRPPVVAFLGHVDHGKTSLLDKIRKANVVSGEAGGITQHIGSYLYDDGQRRVAFLDTPGHAAFTAMRARGADMTDIVVLVVAADDGVMPQTEEAINHAKAAGVTIVVALNKIDLPNADENRVLGQLAEKGLVPTMWGGDIEVVRTSAETGEGINDLVEHLDYIAELKDLRAKKDGPASGWVIEAEMDTGLGVLARVLVKSGELKTGDVIVTGCSFGKVRTIVDATGAKLDSAGPATPVEITGLDEMPSAGDRIFVVDDISQAREIVSEQRIQRREKTLATRRQVTLENLFSEIKAGELKELNVILKGDVQGSVDVLSKSVMEMNTSEVAVRLLHAAVGGISESDVLLAEASNAIIIGFQVVADERARQLAEQEGVEIRLYRVIYQITDDLKKALEGMLTPRVEEKRAGIAEVRNTFRISRLGVIAGCYVTEGEILRSSKIRVLRDNIVLRDDLKIDSLRRVKDDVTSVRSGLECGIKLAGFDDVEVGDKFEAIETVQVSRTLEEAARQ